ncbi:hypothetical protein DYB37_009427 [Aphanomyces astaci]|uniref:Lipid-binding serum glycoprotein C-terminal domain-containing protein n=1 Tax=Aphanomyces astaci TaxID=112090 RepID=A0A397BCQ4_APHAT|nr:hypothetical protein DYB25_005978 [Aphanomyces astaci]RHY79343.1 hypothetical protein DYB26_004129 [Aphanomyces astaci]RHY96933.1 hypothetical protein DYB35_008974 [Aphanomyces astaci]RHZ32685.1 hypothetical protein DYB37_009427 [Aphanomyces astaci]RLO12641.1 hypothetical protein DYB28_002054 [Aphanomyces astaci]
MATISLVSCTPNDAIVLDVPVLPVVMGTVLEAYKPLLADFAKKTLPATVGNCSDSNPPTPCLDTGYLLAQTSALYDIKARWITGINSMTVGNLEYVADAATGTVTLNVVLGFESLPLSLRIDACLAGKCTKFSDGTTACCGGPKTVAIAANVACSESYPFLRNFTFTNIAIRPSVELQFPVNGKPTTLFDVTKPVESGLNATVAAFIQKEGMDLLNNQIRLLFGANVYCTQQAKDAATKAPTTAAPSSPGVIPASTSSGSSPPSISSSPNADAPATSVPSRSTPVPTSNASPVHSIVLTLVPSMAMAVVALFT